MYSTFFLSRSTLNKEFNNQNIEAPYTKQDLYIKELPER